MKRYFLSVSFLACTLSSFANAHECDAKPPPLIDLLNQYSQAHGTKFVVDPRVRARVTLIGIDSVSIDSAMLIGILNMDGFVALAADGVVYAVPDAVARSSADRYGTAWEG